MKLSIEDISFTKDENWVFKLSSEMEDYFVLDSSSYELLGLKSPITKQELDSWDIGQIIDCEVKKINGLNVVTKLL